MPKIHLLEDELINKIAAGEVVERPASVVKELVENAVDAGASAVKVELAEGGVASIVVTDDGCGMAAEDVPLALKRHATSKISAVDDLFAIDSLGFRGEALAAIASVSRLTLQTRLKGAASGTKLVASDGKVQTSPWAGPEGTRIVVDDLFYNVPARRQFLKRSASEFAAILEYMQAMALNIPDISFTLIHNGKEQLRVPAVAVAADDHFLGEKALRARAQKVLGSQCESSLVYSTSQHKHGNLEALLSPPGQDRANSKAMFTFVNGRWVKDKALRYGIQRGYHSHLMTGRSPCVILHVTIDPSLVDVNVHPSKTEVRFQYAIEVQNLIAVLIREALRAGAWAQPLASAAKTPDPFDFDLVSPQATHPRSELGHGIFGEKSPSPADAMRHSPAQSPRSAVAPLPPQVSRQKPRDMTITKSVMSFGSSPLFDLSETPATKGLNWETSQYIGSYGRCYLLFDCGASLLVVDQHAFHERILYEKLMASKAALGESQPLLVPESIALTPEAILALHEKRADLREWGLDFEILDAPTLELKAVPSLLQNANLDQCFHELAADCRPVADSLKETTLGHRILATIACHGAVRAGENLSANEVDVLRRQAGGVDFFLNCPHGRVVFRSFAKAEVEAWFDR